MLKYSTYWSAEQYATTTLDTGEAHSAGAPSGTYSATYSVISGGANNCIDATAASSCFGVIAGGRKNTIGDNTSYATISGGWTNTVCSEYSGTGSGYYNVVSGFNSVISGGGRNTIDVSSLQSFIGGGGEHYIHCLTKQAVIAGGYQNTICCGHYCTPAIFSGVQHNVGGNAALVINGYQNYVCADYGMVANGSTNHVCGGLFASIANGLENCVTSVCGHSCYHMIAGGYLNNIIDTSLVPSSRDFNFIGTGTANAVLDTSGAFIGSGINNSITSSAYSVIAGGNTNIIAPGNEVPTCYNVIAGGLGNTVCAPFGAILGGKGNTVSHAYSAAFGCNVSSSQNCAFHANFYVSQDTPPYSGTVGVLAYITAPASLGLPSGTCLVVTR